jgi:hypothetical protein
MRTFVKVLDLSVIAFGFHGNRIVRRISGFDQD